MTYIKNECIMTYIISLMNDWKKEMRKHNDIYNIAFKKDRSNNEFDTVMTYRNPILALRSASPSGTLPSAII